MEGYFNSGVPLTSEGLSASLGSTSVILYWIPSTGYFSITPSTTNLALYKWALLNVGGGNDNTSSFIVLNNGKSHTFVGLWQESFSSQMKSVYTVTWDGASMLLTCESVGPGTQVSAFGQLFS